MVLGMPWLARHDPKIDWEKCTVVRFGRRGATESDGPVSAADTPNGASEPPSETVARAAVSGRSARSARAVTTPGVVDSKRVSGQRPDTSRMFSVARRRGGNSVSTRELTRARYQNRESVEVTTVCQLWELRHTAPRIGDNKASTPGVDATSCADGCKRPALKLACCRAAGLHEAGRDQAGLDDACPRVQEPAGGRPQTRMSVDRIKERSSMAGPRRNASESGIHKKKRRRRHKTLRKSRSGTETLNGVSAEQTQVATMAVETLNVWNHQYKWVRNKMVHLAAVAAEETSVQSARLFVDMVFKHHGMPTDFVSDRDPRFTARFWQEVFTLLGTRIIRRRTGKPSV
ncbi:reverse transcriptase, partial [Phytophthora megakarya]